MVKKSAPKKETRLSIAVTARDRALIDKAATVLGFPPSVWARSVILKEAAKIISEEKK